MKDSLIFFSFTYERGRKEMGEAMRETPELRRRGGGGERKDAKMNLKSS